MKAAGSGLSWLVFIALTLLATSAPARASCPELLDAQVRPLAQREPVRLCDAYAGKVLLIVNTASKCGFTRQYEGLELLHQQLADRGFAVLGFPSGDFMGQEFDDESDIRGFCTLTYGVRFPMFEKMSVAGESAHPLFRRLAAAGGGAPAWNFHKYLVGRDGKVAASYPSRITPDDAGLRSQIERLLASPATTRVDDAR